MAAVLIWHIQGFKTNTYSLSWLAHHSDTEGSQRRSKQQAITN